MSPYSLLSRYPTLSRGDRHPATKDLQQRLSRQGRPVPATGLFDYDTEIAVKYFQSKMFLTPDGVVGPSTWQALYTDGPVGQPVLRAGSIGAAVKQLQEILAIDLYYRGAVDGNYGSKTQAAVERFQKDWGLEDDGVVDYRVWQCLSDV